MTNNLGSIGIDSGAANYIVIHINSIIVITIYDITVWLVAILISFIILVNGVVTNINMIIASLVVAIIMIFTTINLSGCHDMMYVLLVAS